MWCHLKCLQNTKCGTCANSFASRMRSSSRVLERLCEGARAASPFAPLCAPFGPWVRDASCRSLRLLALAALVEVLAAVVDLPTLVGSPGVWSQFPLPLPSPTGADVDGFAWEGSRSPLRGGLSPMMGGTRPTRRGPELLGSTSPCK